MEMDEHIDVEKELENCTDDNADKNETERKEKSVLKDKKKSKEPGIIYLSRVPPLMNVKIIRNYFNDYGEVGKIFLQPDDKAANTKKGRMFSEGWVEFEDKKVAKKVASTLNNTQIGGKKKSRWYDEIWSLKYLHRFKWAHLNERLAYERAVHKQRMRTEIAQVKREANFYIQNAEKSMAMKKIKERKVKQGKTWEDKVKNNIDLEGAQRLTEEEVNNKRKEKSSSQTDKSKKRKMTEDFVNKKSLAAKQSFINKLFSRSSAGDDDDDDDDDDND